MYKINKILFFFFTFPLIIVTIWSKLLSATICLAYSTMLEHSTPMTLAAPALAANIDKIPVPHPISNTILPYLYDKIHKKLILVSHKLSRKIQLNLKQKLPWVNVYCNT